MKTSIHLLCVLIIWMGSTVRAIEPAANDCGCGLDVPLANDGAVCPAKPQVLIAGIGGWKSCLGATADDQYISNRFLTLVKNIRNCRPDLNVNYVMYCSPGLKTIREEGHVKRYSDLFGAGTVEERKIGVSIGQHKTSPDSKVFVMGHSHGGWMAMRATICLGHVDGLFTMEPVSANLCTTRDYIKNRTRKIFKGRQEIVPDCRRAPTDVNWMSVLNAAGGNWTNFFLAPNTQKGDIYSSPISVAHNHMIWAPAEGKYNAHHNLGMSAETWSVIQSSILGCLDLNTPTSLEMPGQTIEIPGQIMETSSQTIELSTISSPTTPPFPDEPRTWWNKTHEQSQSGTLVEFIDGVAVIKVADGSLRRASLEGLSAEDQVWINSHLQAADGFSNASEFAASAL